MEISMMGIDPAIGAMGCACLLVSVDKPSPFKLHYADTILGELNEYDISDENYHQSKAFGLTRSFKYLLELLNPTHVSCEDNFLGPSVSSFKRLIEVVSFFNIATREHGTPFKLILPRPPKQLVGADFPKATKEDVRDALKRCEFLDLNGYDLDELSDHAWDAILIALYHAYLYYKDLGWNVHEIKKEEPKAKGKHNARS